MAARPQSRRRGRGMCSNYRRAKGYAAMRDEFTHIRLPVRFGPGAAAPNLAPQNEVRPTDQAVVFRRFDDGVELENGRAHVCTPVTNAHLVCRLLLEKKNKNN